ncbi:acetylxylan esterase [Massilia sp. BSC265]|uniref:acetylxylan esterase n=1 Tax=Massilia sp. BSC265 TaxID=1549812 RepID=UPI0006923283|nr:acetylxylan esterase [Massilia sp. BSC265]
MTKLHQIALSRTRSGAAGVLLAAQLLWAGPDCAAAQSEVQVLQAAYPDQPLKVGLSNPDWTYRVGDNAVFHIRIDKKPYPRDGIRITYRMGPDMLEGPERSAVVPEHGLLLAAPGGDEPGFVRCIVSASIDGKPVEAMATAAFSPLELRPVQSEPPDFDAFWAAQKRDLLAVEPDFRLLPAPALSTPEVEVSYLSFQNVGPGKRTTRMYGVLSVPRGPGPFPAVLHVPGAGVRGYKGTPELAAKGFITLQIGIHGIPVDLPAEVYEQLNFGALDGYNRYNLDDPRAYYYRRVYLGTLRALDYLVQHPKWNRKHLATQGGSQGGQLSIMASALHPRVSLTIASYPAYSDVTGYLHERAGGWPGLFRKDGEGRRRDLPVEPKAVTSAYYDTVNFAKRLRTPVLYYAGYNDMVTPPTSTFAVYNVIPTARSFVVEPNQVHLTSQAHRDTMDRWLIEHAAGKR